MPTPYCDAVDEARKQKSALALHGRIGRRHERHVGERHAEKLDAGVLEIEHLLALVMDDPGGLDLPKRRFFRIVLAGLAGGIDAILQHGVIAFGAVGTRRGKARIVGRLQPQRIDKAVADNRRSDR